ncbi:hypothetical protein MACH26_02840 [Planctobacterium marinum]|uniref:Secretin/TonB short N-terminal domain-containing protein n=1 Tax=Planctobacterium marinum TaxID=1631968 RepID=A0AA48HD15_9ALTE|nr:hypothetical protein MACH26_02840 [Planctobacterium marinum]
MQENLTLVYVAQLTNDIQANAVQGEMNIKQALRALLKNTGLRATVSNSRMIKISRTQQPVEGFNIRKYRVKPTVKKAQQAAEQTTQEAEIEAIQVVAKIISPYNLEATVSSTKTQRDFLTTPQIVNAVTESLSQDVGARSYTESSLLASSVNFLERSTGVVEELRLRGFAYPSLKINGVGAHAYISPVDIAFIRDIEIAKGPGSVLFGRMEPGGIINMMLKSPQNSRNSFQLQGASDDYQRLELDLSRSDDDATAIRGIAYTQKHGSESELDQDDGHGVMLALAHHLPNDSELNLHYRFESSDALQRFGSPVDGFNNAVDVFINEEDDIEFVPTRETDLRSGLEEKRHSFYFSINDWLLGDWSADLYLQYDQYSADSLLNYPVIEGFELEIDGELFSDDELTSALLADDEFLEEVLRGLELITLEDSNLGFESDVFQFDTHFFSSELTLYNSQQLHQSLLPEGTQLEQLYGINFNYSKPETLIWQTHDIRSNFVPVEQAETLFNSEAASNDVRDINTGLFAQWAINWHEFTLFAGSRLDYLRFSADREGYQSEEDFFESSHRIGGVYQLSQDSSIFINYSESFTPQFSVAELPIDGQPELPEELDDEDEGSEEFEDLFTEVIAFNQPAQSKQYEIGFKKQFASGRLQSSCALFNIEKRHIVSDIYAQRSRGLECDLSGSLNRSWHITLAASLLDAEITSADSDELLNKQPRMTPGRNFRLWITKILPQWQTFDSRLGFGLIHVGERFIDSSNEEQLEAYTTVDFGWFASYQNRLKLSLLLRNAFDEQYIEGAFNASPAWTSQGLQRTLELRLTWVF